jgi:iron(III) transport system ATP-binding protein
VISVSGLRVSFGTLEVLRGVSVSVETGTLLAVLGPSGCGKTTLLRSVAGFVRPSAGRVEVGGRVLVEAGTFVPAHKRRVAVVPQEGALFPHLSVADNVGFGLPRASRRSGERVAELLALAGLDGLGERMPHELSGGQQQRVAVARALAPEPDVVLLDEPFSALDAALRASLRADVRALLRAAGTTAMLVTHDQEEALSVADSVAVMREGVIVQQGSPSDVYERPADLEVATFLGAANVLRGEADGPTVSCVLGRLALAAPAHGPVRVLARPERLTLDRTGVRGEVVERRYFGHDAIVVVRVGSETLLVRTSEPVAVGAEVHVRHPGPVTVFS